MAKVHPSYDDCKSEYKRFSRIYRAWGGWKKIPFRRKASPAAGKSGFGRSRPLSGETTLVSKYLWTGY